MTSEVRTEAGRFEVSPHACFACGELNAHGLHLVLHVAGETCWTETELSADFQGWEGVTHGGILATVLDEVMGWALASHDAWGYTARLSIEYRRPVLIGASIRAEGWIVERRRRLLRTSGRIVDPRSGDVYASADGVYVAAPEARREELKARYGFRLVPDDAAHDVPGAAGGGGADDAAAAQPDRGPQDARSADPGPPAREPVS